MKLVIDTNVFISGVFFSGPPHQILQAWKNRRIRLVLSPEILAEYQATGEELAAKFTGVDLNPWRCQVNRRRFAVSLSLVGGAGRCVARRAGTSPVHSLENPRRIVIESSPEEMPRSNKLDV